MGEEAVCTIYPRLPPLPSASSRLSPLSPLPSPLSPLPYLCTSSTPSTFPRPPPNPTIRNATPNNPSQPAPISRHLNPPRNQKTLSCTLPQTNRTTSSAATVNEAVRGAAHRPIPKSYLPVFHIIPKPNAPQPFHFLPKPEQGKSQRFRCSKRREREKMYR